METIDKLKILSEDSKYDLACSCGDNPGRKRSAEGRWLYPVILPQGGFTILMKTLISNACVNDCKYCPLRSESDIRRCSLSPESTASVFMDYFRRRMAFGLFLSSGVTATPDITMDRIIATAEILRKKYQFKGYIHLKIIPGASDAAVEKCMSLATAVSLNIETPGEKYFRTLSMKKDFTADIIRPIKLMSELTSPGSKFQKIKLSTQFIVGAAEETDSDIIKYSFGLYKRLRFDRVYFSAYQQRPIPEITGFSLDDDSRQQSPQMHNSLTREHRLYQADFLIRKYKFSENDFSFTNSGNLSLDKDPKEIWADLHPDFYPLNINKADFETLIRIPGIGYITAKKIISQRSIHAITSKDLIPLKGKNLEKASRYIIFR